MNESFTVSYAIRMKTPIGIRLGTMVVTRNCGQISGSLDILAHSEPFVGTIDAQGNCSLFGKIVTLTRTICYDACGRITPEQLNLFIKDGHHALEISGTPFQP